MLVLSRCFTDVIRRLILHTNSQWLVLHEQDLHKIKPSNSSMDGEVLTKSHHELRNYSHLVGWWGKQHPAYFRTVTPEAAHTAVGDPTLTYRNTKWTQYCCIFKKHMKLQRKLSGDRRRLGVEGKGVHLIKTRYMNILTSLTIKIDVDEDGYWNALYD